MKTAFLTTAALAFTTICTGTSMAADFHHVDQLAMQLRNQAARTAWEVRANFRGSPEYRHLYSDVYEMYRTADHIHDVVHQGASLDHLRSDVETLDRLFHHVEDVVRNIRPANNFHNNWGHWHHSSGPSWSDIQRLRRMLNDMEDTLHHLRDDLQFAGPAVPVGPVVQPVPYTLRFGNSKLGFAIQIP